MCLEIGVLPGPQDWAMISEECQGPAIDEIDEMVDGKLDGKKFTSVCAVFLLFGASPEP